MVLLLGLAAGAGGGDEEVLDPVLTARRRTVKDFWAAWSATLPSCRRGRPRRGDEEQGVGRVRAPLLLKRQCHCEVLRQQRGARGCRSAAGGVFAGLRRRDVVSVVRRLTQLSLRPFGGAAPSGSSTQAAHVAADANIHFRGSSSPTSSERSSVRSENSQCPSVTAVPAKAAIPSERINTCSRPVQSLVRTNPPRIPTYTLSAARLLLAGPRHQHGHLCNGTSPVPVELSLLC